LDGDSSRRIPFPFAGGLWLELASTRPRSVDRATTPFPAASTFFELAALEVFGMPGFALFAMPSVDPERHAFLPKSTCELAQHCTLQEGIALKSFVSFGAASGNRSWKNSAKFGEIHAERLTLSC
jgi:hypothetical protein